MDFRKYDETYSIYIRLRDRISGTNKIKCCCCGKIIDWQESDNAHFIYRSNASTRFLDYNCHACCKTCNQFLDGNLKAYEQFLIKKYGKEKVEKLKQLKFQTLKWHKHELDSMLVWWKNYIKEMKFI